MNAVAIIAAREYVERAKSRGFIIGTVIGLLGIVGLSFLPLMFGALGKTFATSIALVGPDRAATSAISSALASGRYQLTIEPQPSRGPDLPATLATEMKKGKFDAALVAYRDPNGALAFVFYPKKAGSLEEAFSLRQRLLRAVILSDIKGVNPDLAERALNFRFKTVNLNERYKSAGDEAISKALVYLLLLLLYMAVLLYGVYVAHGVIEEKSNRVMELMIGAVRPAQLLAGKIIGIGSLALTQLLAFVLAAGAMLVLAGLQVAKSITAPGVLGAQAASAASAAGTEAGIVTVPAATLMYLLVFFLLGFFSYATLFAGVGALASKAEDVQQTNGILVMPVVVAYLLSIFALTDPDKPAIVIASMVPLISPMLMFTRVATSSVPLWQVVVAIGASLACIWALTQFAAKLYRVGVLMYGKPPSPVEIWRALRAHE